MTLTRWGSGISTALSLSSLAADIDAVSELLKKGIEHRGLFYFKPAGRMLLNFKDPDSFRF